MEEPPLSRICVDDPRAAAVFADSTLRRILLAFAARPRSLGELSAESGMDLKRLHHHVQKLCRLGLLDVTGARKRAGRAIKLYRARGSEFFVPHELAPTAFTDGLARELREAIADDAQRSGAGVLFSLGPGGEPLARKLRGEEAAGATLELWRLLRLSTAEAAALSAELGEVLARHAERSAGKGDIWLVHAAVARRRGESFSTDNRRRP